MATLVILTPTAPGVVPGAALLPALALLPHRVRTVPLDASALLRLPVEPDAVVVDAVTDLVAARSTLRALAAMDLDLPVLAVLTEGGLGVVDHEWGADDVVLPTAGPAELSARLRLLLGRGRRHTPRTEEGTAPQTGPVRVADVVVDEASWTVRAGGEPLDLTFKEFELLRFLVHRPGRVVTRDQLLQEVWGNDYYGGTRTVDVHVRRLRAKLGPERESLIGTIRGVGYRFTTGRSTDTGRPPQA